MSDQDSATSQRLLPEGKLYHVFVSYRDSDEDRPWIRRLISELRGKYSFICCDHSTDFQPGRKIVENIQFAISKSMKTLVVLSSGYKESYWCEYEIEYALLMNMDMRERILIPVLKEICDIPEYLKPFTYIDARGSIESWGPKLVAAIESEGMQYSNQTLARLPQVYKNLQILHEDCTKFNCGGPVFTASKYVPESLNKEPMCVNSASFEEVMAAISATTFVTGRHCRSCSCLSLASQWCCLSILLLISLLFLILFLVLGPINKTGGLSMPAMITLMLVLLFASMMGTMLLLCCVTETKGRTEMRKIQGEINRKLMTHNVMLGVKRRRLQAEVKIIFYYYDIQPCLEHIGSSLDSEETSAVPGLMLLRSTAGPSDEEVLIEDKTENIFVDISVPYLNDFLNEKLENRTEKRHTDSVICLCQYAESKGYIKTKT